MKQLFIIVTIALIAGCGSVPVENRREALLMPQPVAETILIKYFGRDWVINPRGRYTQGFGQLCGDRGYGKLPYSEINVIRSFPRSRELWVTKTNWLTVGIPCTQLVHTIQGDFSSDDVNDIVDALVSLGARIEQRPR